PSWPYRPRRILRERHFDSGAVCRPATSLDAVEAGLFLTHRLLLASFWHDGITLLDAERVVRSGQSNVLFFFFPGVVMRFGRPGLFANCGNGLNCRLFNDLAVVPQKGCFIGRASWLHFCCHARAELVVWLGIVGKCVTG